MLRKIMCVLLVVCMTMTLCGCAVEKQSVELNFGEERKLELKKEYEGMTWASSDDQIVCVRNDSVVAVGPGKAVLTAQKDEKAVAEISVSVKLVDITAILFSQKNIEIEVEESVQQQYTLLPDNASDYGLTWKSANTEIAEVDEKGNIRGVAPGTTTVVCSTSSGILDTCEVVVKEPSAIAQLNEDEKMLFDVLTEKVLPSFYNAPAVRVRKIQDSDRKEDHSTGFSLWLDIQGTNKLGGTIFKDYWITYTKDSGELTSWPIENMSILAGGFIESTKIDPAKINAALEEYWNDNIH